jgi:two-component system NtrC family sensor kinase
MAACPDELPDLPPPDDGVVTTIPEKCRRCYTCVRECPAKAIRVEGGQAAVLHERCIACGNCVKVCAQQAKRIIDCVPRVRRMLAGSRPVFACLAPSFPAAFHPAAPGKVLAAIRRLGFAEIWEVALGAELVGREYARVAREIPRSGHVLSTSCPALVFLVQKHLPDLVPELAPIVSPMIATARAIRQRHGQSVRIVFIGPCIAKKKEFRDPAVAGDVDAVLTFEELERMLAQDQVAVETLAESGFDSPRCHLGRSFAISGGLLKTAGLRADILENDTVVAEGKRRVRAALDAISGGRTEAHLFDILLCDGCVNGPVMLNNLSGFMRKEVVADYVREQGRRTTEREVVEAVAEFGDVELWREFTASPVALREPGAEEIGSALRQMKKFAPEDRLDCGACGYRTCREKAVAVCQGLAEPEMCLPYLVDELQQTCIELRHSHDDLAAAQRRLVHTEKLASMGQLSAGVAHEINNPLGVVLIYSHMLLKDLQETDPRRDDLDVIVREATRCRDIVRGLLDFARQSRVNKSPTDLGQLVREVVSIMESRLAEGRIRLVTEFAPGLPVMMVDALQIKQLLVNLVQNGIDAIAGEGEVRVSARTVHGDDTLELRVADTGCGVPEQHLAKLFTPFFTTKEQGRGTGLGLAIAYGVVKMHCGDIVADSTVGKGTTFTITLPVVQEQLETAPPV